MALCSCRLHSEEREIIRKYFISISYNGMKMQIKGKHSTEMMLISREEGKDGRCENLDIIIIHSSNARLGITAGEG